MILPSRLPRLLRLATGCLAVAPLALQAAGTHRSTAADRRALAVTVYSQDLGLVRETREMELAGGVQEVEFDLPVPPGGSASVTYRVAVDVG